MLCQMENMSHIIGKHINYLSTRNAASPFVCETLVFVMLLEQSFAVSHESSNVFSFLDLVSIALFVKNMPRAVFEKSL